MGRPRRYRESVQSPFDVFAGAWSKESRKKARRGNRKAYWWISNLWYTPSHLMAAIGAVLVILLLVGSGSVTGAFCIHTVGCVGTQDRGITATPAASRP